MLMVGFGRGVVVLGPKLLEAAGQGFGGQNMHVQAPFCTAKVE